MTRSNILCVEALPLNTMPLGNSFGSNTVHKISSSISSTCPFIAPYLPAYSPLHSQTCIAHPHPQFGNHVSISQSIL